MQLNHKIIFPAGVDQFVNPPHMLINLPQPCRNSRNILKCSIMLGHKNLYCTSIGLLSPLYILSRNEFIAGDFLNYCSLPLNITSFPHLSQSKKRPIVFYIYIHTEYDELPNLLVMVIVPRSVKSIYSNKNNN